MPRIAAAARQTAVPQSGRIAVITSPARSTAMSWMPSTAIHPAGRTKLWVSSIWAIFAWISTPAIRPKGVM